MQDTLSRRTALTVIAGGAAIASVPIAATVNLGSPSSRTFERRVAIYRARLAQQEAIENGIYREANDNYTAARLELTRRYHSFVLVPPAEKARALAALRAGEEAFNEAVHKTDRAIEAVIFTAAPSLDAVLFKMSIYEKHEAAEWNTGQELYSAMMADVRRFAREA